MPALQIQKIRMTTRRKALLALPLLCSPLFARAQKSQKAAQRRLGILYAGSSDDITAQLDAFVAEMGRRGWFDNENIVINTAFAKYDAARLTPLVEDLVRNRTEIIVTFGQAAPVAAARATATIPIVFVDNTWPLERGLIDSYARPGRNATGIALSTGIEATTKRLDFLREIVPSATRLAWTGSSTFLFLETVSGAQHIMIPALTAAAKERGFESRIHEVRDWQNLEPLFKEIAAASAQALMSLPVPRTAIRRFTELATRYRLPTAYFDRENVEAGGLLSYGTPESESLANAARAAEYVDRILRGAKAANLAVYTPDRYELVINLKTARALGVAVPQSLLLRAQAVIQ